jgi:hypothetical protein
MGVHEAGGDHQPVRIHLALPLAVDIAHSRDPVSNHGHIPPGARAASAVDDQAPS